MTTIAPAARAAGAMYARGSTILDPGRACCGRAHSCTAAPPFHRPRPADRSIVAALTVVLNVLLVLTSAFLILTILMHKGKGGGISDMFGGGVSSSVGGSGVAERNLNRLTISVAIVWTLVIVLLGLIVKFTG